MNAAIVEKYVPATIRNSGVYLAVTNYIQTYVGMKEGDKGFTDGKKKKEEPVKAEEKKVDAGEKYAKEFL